MERREAVDFTWTGAAERLDRLAEANRRATERWLGSLSEQESIRIFESLCEGIPELDEPRAPLHRPVALFRIWRP